MVASCTVQICAAEKLSAIQRQRWALTLQTFYYEKNDEQVAWFARWRELDSSLLSDGLSEADGIFPGQPVASLENLTSNVLFVIS